ncbi:MAG TPA: methylmalonyl-CoA mutase family protein [Thermodesulfobacteriota bacterium]|nr:methylmalonyl-CoA mutase family protein [Thermodesulfobacteriota bacterium]
MDKMETPSGIPIKLCYRPEDIHTIDYKRDLADPGQYPFTRGIYPDMYRGRVWTLRSQIGYGTPEDTNQRILYLYKQGQTGFTMTIDLPTSYGFDSDHPLAEGEVGVTGVPVSTLEDMETIFNGLSPAEVRASLSIRPPVSAVILAMYVAVAEKKGVPQDQIIGTQQDDPLFQMSGGPLQTHIQFFPLDQIMRLCVDVAEYCTRYLPRLNWMPANGYNIRETGVNAVQEGAFAIAGALNIANDLIKRGLKIDDFAPRLTFFQSSHIDFFEEVAKFRAMRRLWARIIKERFGAENPRSCWFRTSVQTAGSSLTTQQPLNNLIRATIESMTAVLSGIQSLQPSSYDEGLSLPTEESATLSLRIQQIIAHETGITQVVDPLAGSYYLESLTDRYEEEISRLIAKIEEMGGIVEAVRSGWLESQILEARVNRQKEIEKKEKILVGVNEYKSDQEAKIKIHRIRTGEWEKKRRSYLKDFRKRRDALAVKDSLKEVKKVFLTSQNMIPVLVRAVKAGATMGEIHDAMREAIGFNYEY